MGDADIGLLLGSALWRYWQLRGSVMEGRERLELLLTRPGGSEWAHAMAQARVASLANVQGDHDTVRRLGEASLPGLRRMADDRVVALHLCLLCNSALATGDAARAHVYAEEALELARRAADPMTEAYASASAGLVHVQRGELDEAERLLDESVRLSRLVGNVRSVANWLRSLGGISIARGDYTRARLCFEESLALHRSLGDMWGISRSLLRLAFLHVETHENDTARGLLAESVALERELSDRPGLIFTFDVFAALSVADDRPARAVRLSAYASVLRKSVGAHSLDLGWPDHALITARMRAELGEERFAEAWAQGEAMTLDESLAYALQDESELSVASNTATTSVSQP